MKRANPRQVSLWRCEGKFLGVGLFAVTLAVGSVAVYQCSPNSQVPLLPSDTASQPQQTSSQSQQQQQQPANNQQPSSSNAQQPSDNPPVSSPSQTDRNNLATMQVVTLQVGSQTFYAWIAGTQTEQELGLMEVQPSEMADNQGMLFVFQQSQTDGFWMKDTIIPLDIAFIRNDGVVVDIQQMEPLSLAIHQPSVPYQFALEVNAGDLSQAGLQVGDTIQIPSSVLNPS